MKKIIFFISLIVLVAIIGYFIFNFKLSSSVNLESGQLHLAGLKNSVTIRRDKLGVPLIEAQNEEDLFVATGYVMANDRLWQMIAMKMAIQGRLTEFAGEEMLHIDLFMRSLNAKKFVDKSIKNLNKKSLKILEKFAFGVNEYIRLHKNLPAEFLLTGFKPDKWKLEDSLYVFGFLSLNISFNFIEELDYLILAQKIGYDKAKFLVPVYPDEKLPMDEVDKLRLINHKELVESLDLKFISKLRNDLKNIMPLSVPASNNWALAGSRTKSGKSIVTNDTHLALTMPNSWMMMHLKCPTYDVAGVALPGVPFVTLGFNGKISWGATMVMGDNQDIFIEKMKKKGDKLYYLYKGSWIKAKERKEIFKLKSGKTKQIIVNETIHGPIINESIALMNYPSEMAVQPLPFKSKFGLSISWLISGGAETFSSFYKLGKSKNFNEAKKNIKNIRGTYLNIIYGDKDNIGWQVTGLYPLRKKGRGLLPSPGWSGEYDWSGFLNRSNHPSKINPQKGFLATANNRTVSKNFPHVLSTSWYHPERAERLNDVLSKTKDATSVSMSKLQFEQFSLMAFKVQNLLFKEKNYIKIEKSIENLLNVKDRKYAKEALNFLSKNSFDCVMGADSDSAAVFGTFVYSFTRETFLDDFGPDNSILWEAFIDMGMTSYSAAEDHLLVRDKSPFFDNLKTIKVEKKYDVIAKSLSEAVKFCETKMGTNRKDWKWGRIHTYTWRHEFTKKTIFFHDYLNRGPYPAGGDIHSLNVGTFAWGKDFEVWNLPAMRMVVDFGLKEPATLILTHGQSGNPSSNHYDDMLPYFLKGKTLSLPFKNKNIDKQYKNELKLIPEE